jgi:hypothetical protein
MNASCARRQTLQTLEKAHQAIAAEQKRLKAAVPYQERLSLELLSYCLYTLDRVRAKLGSICDEIASAPGMEGIRIPPSPRNASTAFSLAGKTADEQAEILNRGEADAMRRRMLEAAQNKAGKPERRRRTVD